MKKEEFEWVHSWCDNTGKKDLPRVLLIGDSITYGYNNFVREELKDKAYVDYIATSYAIDNSYYKHLIVEFAKNSKYDLIHFNFCLHGFHINDLKYEKIMRDLINKLSKLSKVTLVEGTKVIYKKKNKKNIKEESTILSRNAVVNKLAEELHLNIDKLFSISENLDDSFRYEDGIHYLENGYRVFGKTVADFILKNL